MPRLWRRSHRQDLIDDDIFKNTNKVSLSKRVDYAWKVCYSKKTKYTEHDRETALKFLKETFEIHVDHDPVEVKRTLEALMRQKVRNPRKIKNYIPTLADIAPKVPPPVIDPVPVAPAPLIIGTPGSMIEESPPPIRHVTITAPSFKLLQELKLNRQRYTRVSSQEDRKRIDQEFRVLNKRHKFLIEINHDFAELNTLIDNYNDSHDKTIKLVALQKIYQQQKKIDYKFPSSCINSYPNYHTEIHNNLFSDLKKQLPSFSMTTLSQLSLPGNHSVISAHAVETKKLAYLLESMSPEKASKMLGILSASATYDKEAFIHLYEGETTEEATLFNDFFSTHSIDFLGGSNTRNFEISLNPGREKIVLKVENRLDTPQDLEASLRKEAAFHDILTPVFAERKAYYTDPDDAGAAINRTVLITTYCAGGSLEANATHHTTDNEKITAALHLFTQMAEILIKMQQRGCAFPDMKNANWLVDADEKLVIADTKSFLFSDEAIVNLNDPENRWYGFTRTSFISPPEYETAKSLPFSADKAHAYMFGKNLYQYLTGCEYDFLMGKHCFKNSDFTAPIFTTPEGKELKKLIITLVQPKAHERISVDKVILGLKKIESLHRERSRGDPLDTIYSPGTREIRAKMKEGSAVQSFHDFKGMAASINPTSGTNAEEQIQQTTDDKKLQP